MPFLLSSQTISPIHAKHKERNKPPDWYIFILKIYSHRDSDRLISILNICSHRISYCLFSRLNICSHRPTDRLISVSNTQKLQIVSFAYWTFVHTDLQIVPFSYWTPVHTGLFASTPILSLGFISTNGAFVTELSPV